MATHTSDDELPVRIDGGFDAVFLLDLSAEEAFGARIGIALRNGSPVGGYVVDGTVL